MTLALSNFMRQAAREDILAYSICSAVLEGTTTDRGAYNPYYEKCAEHYGCPAEAIAPIYAHLDLDVQYQHSDLFLEILSTVETIPAARAGRVLEYGHQLVEHIWMWTDNIEKYYERRGEPDAAPCRSIRSARSARLRHVFRGERPWTTRCPLLKRTARSRSRRDEVAIIEYLADEVTLEGTAAQLFGKMLPHLDGKTRPRQHRRADRRAAPSVAALAAASCGPRRAGASGRRRRQPR